MGGSSDLDGVDRRFRGNGVAVPTYLDALNSWLEWPKRISSSGEVCGLRVGAGILDLSGWAMVLLDCCFRFGKVYFEMAMELRTMLEKD
jgi:hypothetical protein